MQISINVVTNIIAMALAMLVNIFLAPFIIKKMGLEIYGYFGIISNFLALLSVVTFVLNSMVGRFYTVELSKHEYEKSNIVISTAYFLAAALIAVLMPLILYICFNLDTFIILETTYSHDVKLAFLFSCIASLLSIVALVLYTGAYALNRLEVNNFIRIIAIVVRVAVILCLLNYLVPRLYYIGVAAIVEVMISVALAYFTFKKLVPQLDINTNYFDANVAKALLKSGWLNAIVLLGNILMSQVVLIISNHYMDAYLVGVLASMLIIANAFKSIASAISSAYSPTTIALYAKQNYVGMYEQSLHSIKATGMILCWGTAVFAVLSNKFFSIWISKDFSQYHTLIAAMSILLALSLSTSQLFVLHQAFNRLKLLAIITITSGITSIIIMLILFKSGYELWSAVIGGNIMFYVQNVIILPVCAARRLNMRKTIFFNDIFRLHVLWFLAYILCIYIDKLFVNISIGAFLLECCILSVAYWGIAILLSNKTERQYAKSIIEKLRGK